MCVNSSQATFLMRLGIFHFFKFSHYRTRTFLLVGPNVILRFSNMRARVTSRPGLPRTEGVSWDAGLSGLIMRRVGTLAP